MHKFTLLRALTSFHINVFKKRFDMFSQCLVPSVTKKHFLLVGSGKTATHSSSNKKIISNVFNLKLFL